MEMTSHGPQEVLGLGEAPHIVFRQHALFLKLRHLVDPVQVLGDPEQLTRILLHGMEGPVAVNGKIYDTPDILPVMPAFNSTPERDLAAVMTYIRQEWGHKASAIDPRTVGGIRVKTQGKVTPWSVTELLEIETEKN